MSQNFAFNAQMLSGREKPYNLLNINLKIYNKKKIMRRIVRIYHYEGKKKRENNISRGEG